MYRDIREVITGEVLARDIFSKRGVLLLKAGTVLNRKLKILLQKHKVTMVAVEGELAS